MPLYTISDLLPKRRDLGNLGKLANGNLLVRTHRRACLLDRDVDAAPPIHLHERHRRRITTIIKRRPGPIEQHCLQAAQVATGEKESHEAPFRLGVTAAKDYLDSLPRRFE